MRIIKINGVDYKIKYTIRALFIFEQITGKPFQLNSLLDNYIFFYSMIRANNDTDLKWDDFLDAIDNDNSLFLQMSEVIVEENEKNTIFNKEEEKDSETKKV